MKDPRTKQRCMVLHMASWCGQMKVTVLKTIHDEWQRKATKRPLIWLSFEMSRDLDPQRTGGM